jgi:hypothetical protein
MYIYKKKVVNFYLDARGDLVGGSKDRYMRKIRVPAPCGIWFGNYSTDIKNWLLYYLIIPSIVKKNLKMYSAKSSGSPR